MKQKETASQPPPDMSTNLERSLEDRLEAAMVGFARLQSTPGDEDKDVLADIDDPYGVVLRGHVWVEASMRESCRLNPNLINQKSFDAARLSFFQLMHVCISFGIVPESLALVLPILNAIRNRLAHQHDAKITNHDFRRLLVALPTRVKLSILNHTAASKSLAEKLAVLLRMIFALLYVHAEHHVKSTVETEFALKRAEAVLGRIRTRTNLMASRD
jgi:hypothetical protein